VNFELSFFGTELGYAYYTALSENICICIAYWLFPLFYPYKSLLLVTLFYPPEEGECSILGSLTFCFNLPGVKTNAAFDDCV